MLCLQRDVGQLTLRLPRWYKEISDPGLMVCDGKTVVRKYIRSHCSEEMNSPNLWGSLFPWFLLSSVPLWTVFQVRVTYGQKQSSDRPTDPHPANHIAKRQPDHWAGTWSAETSWDFQEVQHQGSVCVIDLAMPPASTIPPARGSLASQEHICVCVRIFSLQLLHTANQRSVLCSPDGWPGPSWFLLFCYENWTHLNHSILLFLSLNTRTLYASNQLPSRPVLFLCMSLLSCLKCKCTCWTAGRDKDHPAGRGALCW